MPYKSKRRCGKSGCPNLVNAGEGYCREHKPVQHYDSSRYNYRWRKLSKLFLSRKPNGKRQFNHCFVEVCKKSGKSELAAAIALLLLCVCYEEHCRALDILEGRKTDPTFYPVVFYAKDDDDWTSEETWQRVNPSYGKIVEEEFYHNFCQTAKQDVSLEMHFRQYFLCQWVYSAKRWLPMDKYDLGATPIDMDWLKGRACYGGLDLASSDDIAAFVLVFPPDEADGKYHVLPFFWIPENNMIRRVRKDKVLYQKWHQEGFLNATDGNIIHYDFIEQKILELSKIYNIKEVMYDQWGANI